MIELIFIVIFGAVIGSFLNVVIARVPENKSIVFPASHCPHCKESLKWYHNIPIFSFIFLRGKCGFCSSKISIQYPLIELITALIAVVIYIKLGATLLALIVFIMFALLIALAIIDLIYLAVPDSINFLALFFAIAAGYFTLETISNAFIVAGGLSLLRMFMSFILKKEAMGEADIILGATMGAFLGIKGAMIALFLASLVAIAPAIVRRKKGIEETPFIPFLVVGIFLAFLFQSDIIYWLKI